MLKLLTVTSVLLTGLALWLNYADVPLPAPAQHHYVETIDPAYLPPDPPPLQGVYEPNEVLRKAHRLFDGVVRASEHVAISSDGAMTLLDKFGYLYEARPDGQGSWSLEQPPLAYVGPGHPLAFHEDAEGNIIIADSLKGLVKLHRGSLTLEVLANRVSPDAEVDPGWPLTFLNGLDIAKDGTIYFSTSQDIPVGLSPEKEAFYDIYQSYMLGIFSGARTGRLLKYDPRTRRTEVLIRGVWYANGVALSHDESFVAVVDTNRMRVQRYWLKGPKAGTSEILIDRLPGFPDGISRASDGNLWVTLVVPPLPEPRLLRFKALRVLCAYIPLLRPKAKKWGAVVKVSPTGQPLQLLMDPDGSKVAFVSAVAEHDGQLFIANVQQNYVSYLDMQDVPPIAGSS